MMYVTRTGGDEAQQNMPEIFQTAQVMKIEKAKLVAPAPVVTKKLGLLIRTLTTLNNTRDPITTHHQQYRQSITSRED